eukprot:2997447-Prymnesium_polylepis.1
MCGGIQPCNMGQVGTLGSLGVRVGLTVPPAAAARATPPRGRSRACSGVARAAAAHARGSRAASPTARPAPTAAA